MTYAADEGQVNACQGVVSKAPALKCMLNLQVMFLQGGGTAQFSAVPLNLTKQGDTVDYLVTGSWSKKAAQEAQAYGLNVNVAAKGDMASVPDQQTWKLSSDATYVCYCDNETIQVRSPQLLLWFCATRPVIVVLPTGCCKVARSKVLHLSMQQLPDTTIVCSCL